MNRLSRCLCRTLCHFYCKGLRNNASPFYPPKPFIRLEPDLQTAVDNIQLKPKPKKAMRGPAKRLSSGHTVSSARHIEHIEPPCSAQVDESKQQGQTSQRRAE